MLGDYFVAAMQLQLADEAQLPNRIGEVAKLVHIHAWYW
jgi:hypothetical protein